MNEYEFTVYGEENENGNEDRNRNYYQPQKNKKHTGAKIAAGILAMVLVSGGSIGIYSQVTKNNQPQSIVASNDVEDSTKATTTKVENVSMVEPQEIQGSVLSTEAVVEKVLPSVVGIESIFEITTSQSNSMFGDDMFGSFGFGFGGGFGGNSQQQTTETPATGTGVIISEDGYIVTNAHVIYDTEYSSGKAKSVSVLLNDDTSYDAEIISYDTDCDLAVLKINAKGLTAAEFGNSDELKLGESVIAIGNPLGFDLMDTVTSGIVSGLNRQITVNDKSMNLLQTDAAINSGNSGGPLINKYGQVIGINSSKMSASYSQTSIEGIGFAIPSNDVSRIVDDMMEYGYVTGKPQLGLSCQDVTETISKMYNLPVGIYIVEVSSGSAAEKAGLTSGDIITKFDGSEVKTTDELNAKKNTHLAGDEIEITFVRSGEEKTVTIVLDEAKVQQ